MTTAVYGVTEYWSKLDIDRYIDMLKEDLFS